MPVLAVGAILLAGFVAAGMMVFAAFARTFREGQTMVQPFYLAVLIPTVFLSSRGTELSLGLAAVPVVNVALVTRQALSGVFHVAAHRGHRGGLAGRDCRAAAAGRGHHRAQRT